MTKKQYIHLAIMILLTVLIGICPPFGAITQVGMRTIGVFVGVLYGWLTIDLIWPSLFGYAALAILGITDTTSALSSGFGNSQLVQVLVVMVMAGALLCDMMLGAVAGGSIPLIFRALGRDPAQASSIFLTTITDGAGFFIFLGLATMFLF